MSEQTLQLPAVFDRYRDDIDAGLRMALGGRDLPLYDMLRYHLGWLDEQGKPLISSSGKALRPTLCLLASEANRGERHRVLPAAVAIELVHHYSLIHDDIQDNDTERHHRPTVWSIWGKSQAINAGSAMRVLASLVILGLDKCGVSRQKRLEAQRLLDESCLQMIEGQYLDISYERRLDISIADYLDMVVRKTAALIGCATEMGALLSVDSRDNIEGLRNFGQSLGLAFQMRDDILGIWGEDRHTGKPHGNDIRRRKKSLPVVYALEKASGKSRKELLAIYQKEQVDDADLKTVLEELDVLKARSYTQEMATTYCRKALSEIEGLDLPDAARRDLEEIAYFLADRDF
ncbi:MAG: polyprenyl synthetase family protein [Dehalococcoidia bacterium]|nr:polyprenyl synthetase family protein [Dehalococcoidia bacterium]